MGEDGEFRPAIVHGIVGARYRNETLAVEISDGLREPLGLAGRNRGDKRCVHEELNVTPEHAVFVLHPHEQVGGLVRQCMIRGVEIGDVEGSVTFKQPPALRGRVVARYAQARLRKEDFEDGSCVVLAVLAQANRCGDLGAQTRAHDPIQFAVVGGLCDRDCAHHCVVVAHPETRTGVAA